MNEKDYLPLRLTCNGETREFAYKWKTFNKEDLIVQLESIANNQLTTLVLGKDYDVDIEDMGGNVILFNAPTDEYYINISRNTPQYQSKEFLTSSGFQASEVEKSFDKVSCNLQEMDYNIDTFKKDFTTEINNKFSDFSDEYQDTIDAVNQAVEKINQIDNTVLEANQAAMLAKNKALEATTQAELAKQSAQAVEEVFEEIDALNLADVSFSNINDAAKEVIRQNSAVNASEILEVVADKVDMTNTQWALNACMPDYSAGVTVSGFPYTAPKSGYLCFAVNPSGSNVNLLVNNNVVSVFSVRNAQPWTHNVELLVSKNDVISASNNNLVSNITFFPMKGANNA